MRTHIKLYTGTSILVNRLAQLLDEQDIPTIIRDDQESGRLAGFGTFGDSVELLIFDSDKQKATAILEEFKKEIAL